MVIKRYNVSLEEEVVNKALEIAEKQGGKLSPLINRFLQDYVKKKESNK
jgi:metal-responsive CopG/Arc/MetJ family transcriptional regulator